MMGSASFDLSVLGALATWGYQVAPALVLGLTLVAALTLSTMAMRLVLLVRRLPEATRRYRPDRDREAAAVSDAVVLAPFGAFLELEDGNGATGPRFLLPRDMVRIGREDDNDIRIPSGAVHRYHAAIHREEFDSWHITDLSGLGGNGVVVNGRKCADATLHDGDLIELGPGRLRFHATYA